MFVSRQNFTITEESNGLVGGTSNLRREPKKNSDANNPGRKQQTYDESDTAAQENQNPPHKCANEIGIDVGCVGSTDALKCGGSRSWSGSCCTKHEEEEEEEGDEGSHGFSNFGNYTDTKHFRVIQKKR